MVFSLSASAEHWRQSEGLKPELIYSRGRRPRQVKCHKQRHLQVGGILLLQGLIISTDLKVGGGRPLAGGAKGREVETGAVARVRYLLTSKTLLVCLGTGNKDWSSPWLHARNCIDDTYNRPRH